MLLTKEVEITWANVTKGHYEELGYYCSTSRSKITVKTEHLMNGSSVKVEVMCDYCGEIVSKKYSNFLRGRKNSQKDCCKKCGTKKQQEAMIDKHGVKCSSQLPHVKEIIRNTQLKYTIEDCIKLFSDSGYILLESEYINNGEHMRYLCRKHIDDGELKISLGNFLSGHGCYYCGRESMSEKQTLSYGYVKNFIENDFKHIQELTLISDSYISNQEKLDLIDSEGYKYEMSFMGIARSYATESKLSRFHKANKYTIHNIKLWIEDAGLDYIVLSNNYNGNSRNLKFICDKGHVFYMTWANLFSGQRCSVCSSSKGERRISKYLTCSNISFKTEYSFSDLRSINDVVLRFDFAIMSKSDDKLLLIEYDGIQHFEPIDFKGNGVEFATEQHKKTIYHDNIKNQYCKDNNIPLLRIPYWEFDNIETILHKYLVKYGLIEEELKEIV